MNVRVNATNIFGRHSVKTGFEYLMINTDVQDTNPLYGLDTYSSQFSRPAGAAANNLYNLADFYFGARTQYELATLDRRRRCASAPTMPTFRTTCG